MRLHKIIMKDGQIDWKKSWTSPKPYSLENLKQANLRELYDSEVVLDYESDEEAELGKKKLRVKKIAYRAYSTQSRGQHIHMRFKGLSVLSLKQRVYYREAFIKEFKADESKKSGWLAIENRVHFKSGKLKKLKDKFGHEPNDFIYTYLEIANKRIAEEEEAKASFNEVEDDARNMVDLAKKYGFVVLGSQGDEVYGYTEKSSRMKHFWINNRKRMWFDFHKGEGGGVSSLKRAIKGEKKNGM